MRGITTVSSTTGHGRAVYADCVLLLGDRVGAAGGGVSVRVASIVPEERTA
jgi:hypothetical protein